MSFVASAGRWPSRAITSERSAGETFSVLYPAFQGKLDLKLEKAQRILSAVANYRRLEKPKLRDQRSYKK